jgi:hypothetical protein
MVVMGFRKGVGRRVLGGGGGPLGAFVASVVTLIKGGCWTCWIR